MVIWKCGGGGLRLFRRNPPDPSGTPAVIEGLQSNTIFGKRCHSPELLKLVNLFSKVELFIGLSRDVSAKQPVSC